MERTYEEHRGHTLVLCSDNMEGSDPSTVAAADVFVLWVHSKLCDSYPRVQKHVPAMLLSHGVYR